MFFSSFRLDVSNHELWNGQRRVPLRPKTFAVLRYLAERADRLVTRDELVSAIWPDIRGAEKAPKRCIFELRAALGDRADNPRFIETVGRLGYRFIAAMSNGDSVSGSEAPTPNLGALDPYAQPPASAFVGRESELAQLYCCLDRAFSGQRQVVFVTGEPGIGKTSLVDTFVHQLAPGDELKSRSGRLWIGSGQCIEHFGEGEAYLPVLEAIAQLAALPDGAVLVDLLRRHAPSWLAQLPALVSARERTAPPNGSPEVTSQRMLREIADVISVLSAQVPLVLVLEDLHWSDYATLDLLTSIAHHKGPARLLVIGTYRSTGLADDHPLRAATQELLSHGRARELALTGLTLAGVLLYLDARFPEHAFPVQLAQVLHDRTDGNPLFFLGYLEDLMTQGLLCRNAEGWTLQAAAETVAARVPSTSRCLIEKQIARLPSEMQPLLEAASIAGVEFTAETVASALGPDTEYIEKCCDALVRQELFLQRQGVDEWADGTRSTRYRFRHALYQELWSERVPPHQQQRLRLHIGEQQKRAFGAPGRNRGNTRRLFR